MSELVVGGSKYSDSQRRQAALEYSIQGVMTKVAKSTGIPRQTLDGWLKSSWWEQAVGEVRQGKEDLIRQHEEIILASNTEIAIKAGEVVMDRLEHGEVKLIRKGDGYVERRVPVSARDAVLAGGLSQDKRRTQLNLPTSISSHLKGKEKIEALIKQFQDIAHAHRAELKASVVSEQ